MVRDNVKNSLQITLIVIQNPWKLLSANRVLYPTSNVYGISYIRLYKGYKWCSFFQHSNVFPLRQRGYIIRTTTSSGYFFLRIRGHYRFANLFHFYFFHLRSSPSTLTFGGSPLRVIFSSLTNLTHNDPEILSLLQELDASRISRYFAVTT